MIIVNDVLIKWMYYKADMFNLLVQINLGLKEVPKRPKGI